MRFSRLGRFLIAVGVLLWSGACSAMPASTLTPAEATMAPVSAPTASVGTSTAPTTPAEQPTAAPVQPTAAPEILEKRRLTLEWPATMRAGDSDDVRLTLELDASGNLVSTAEISGHQTSAQVVQIPDLFKTHNVMAEARLDLAGVQVVPDTLVSQTLLPGQRVDFHWSVKPEEVGIYRGNVWFYLRFIPINGGAESQRTISAQPIQIRAVDMLGLTGTPARVLGALGTLVGSALGLDNIVSWIWKLIRRKKGE